MNSILIIESCPDLRANLAELIEMSGYNALTASNGKEALTTLAKNVPQIILCDLVLPEASGLSFIHSLNGASWTSSIPLILFIEGSTPFTSRPDLKDGTKTYLAKPFTSEQLLNTINKIAMAKSNSANAA